MKGAVILAGGKYKRMGKNKALMNFRGKPLLNHVLDKVLVLDYETIVVISKNDSQNKYYEVIPSKVPVVKDEKEDKGPLLGIFTGLKHISSEYALVLPCDTPFINQEVIEYLFSIARGYDAVIPRWPNGYIEPLHAVYKVSSTIKAAENAIEQGKLFINDMIKQLNNVFFINTRTIRKFDQGLITFVNINSEEDFKKAKKIMTNMKY